MAECMGIYLFLEQTLGHRKKEWHVGKKAEHRLKLLNGFDKKEQSFAKAYIQNKKTWKNVSQTKPSFIAYQWDV